MTAADAPTAPLLYAATDPGLVHHTNEDSWAALDTADGALVLMVCDGMGGMGHGDEASQLAIRCLIEELSDGAADPGPAMLGALTRIDVRIRDALCAGGKGLPGTTAVLAWIREGWAQVGWVGDSRAYWIRGRAVVERTRDHKLVEELIAAGQLTETEAKNSMLSHVVTRAIGGRSPDEVAVEGSLTGPWALEAGDRVVLCSDGVCDLLSDEEIAGAVGGTDPKAGGDALVRLAIERGGHDNITAIVLLASAPSAAVPQPRGTLRGTSVSAKEPPPPAPAARAPEPMQAPPVRPVARATTPEDEFLKQNQDWASLAFGALAAGLVLLGLAGWFLLS